MIADQMQIENSKLLNPELTEKIIGIYYDVYNEVGFGFLESVYRNCMEIALTESGILVQREYPIPVYFRGKEAGQFRADLLVTKQVLLELKAAQSLDRSHEAQILNYLRATDMEIGLLLNFGSPRPQFRRIVFENSRKIRVHPRASAVGGS
ncbi:MAG TPA: GxxExxY protein [Terriglobales bacterium]|nr:GxxExxY protein [Terriglobales bacterium]